MKVVTVPPERVRIGWICAVEIEYIAACELLDEEYQTVSSGHNIYTTGRMSGHDIVLSCLPKGEYGLASAASVAMDMMKSFPSIRFGLMVGIGGGAPSAKHDVRLGDVVVSSPTGQHGGVIHYAYGKALQGGEFQRTGTMNAPPRLLRSASQSLDVQHKRKGHHINQTIQSMLESNPRLRARHECPGPENDVLYQPFFVHADSSRSCTELGCKDHGQIVARTVRDPHQDNPAIHYGLIASADQLMKDAAWRDRLAESDDVLCFEMESSGLMNTFPCIVIRGICDYSDSHKNDVWQGYAALTAAAYAKEFLAIIPPKDVLEMEETARARVQQTPAQPPMTGTASTVNNFTGTFRSQGKMINNSTFDTKGGDMYIQ